MENKILLFIIFTGSVLLWSCSDDDDDANGQDHPEACFEVVGTSVKAGDEITFTNCSKNATVYAWDFGDGTTSSEKDPAHTYTEGRTFTVWLLAGSDTNADGALTTDDIVDVTSETVDVVVKSAELTIVDGTTWTPEETQLETVEGATVDLYRNRDSFDSSQPELTATSDENGKVVFNNLETDTYYLMVVTKGDLSNIKDGFVISGVFQNQEEIDNANAVGFQPGNPKPGDFRFLDLNGDGNINSEDKRDYGFLDYRGELIEREIVIGK